MKRYMMSRQAQKLSLCGPARSPKPAIARWKAWLCRSARPGSTGPGSVLAPSALFPAATETRYPRASVSKRTSRAQPVGSRAWEAKKLGMGLASSDEAPILEACADGKEAL
jgi:hypothetical protein